MLTKHLSSRFSFTALSSILFAGWTHADLIGHWAFDEGSGLTASDSSGQGNDGTITTAEWGTDEERGSYLIFNGFDSFVDPSLVLPAMTILNDFTWALWVNSQEDIGGTQQNAVVIGNRNDASGVDFTPRQFIKITPTKFEWHQNGNGNDNLDVDDLEFDNTWHHIAVVKTGINFEYFFDGVSVGTHALTEVIGTAENPLFIGGQANNASVNEYFNGFLDDVRIYDEALTQEDVVSLIALGNSGSGDNLEITNFTLGDNNDISLTWSSRANTTYVLEASTTLDADDWIEIDDSIVATGDTTTINLPGDKFPNAGAEDQLFFRVRKPAL